MNPGRFLSTLNLVFVIIGYQFATSLLIPIYGGDIEGATRVVTIPYRLFTIALATAVIIQSISKYGASIRQNRTTWLLTVFWTMLLFRLFYDLEVRTDFFLLPGEMFRVWLYALLLCLYSGLSVAYSYRDVDLKLAFRLTAIALSVTLTLSLINNPLLLAASEEIAKRMDGNAALTTIAFGQLGITAIIIGGCMIVTERNLLIRFVLPAFLIIIGTLISLRSGSRGPLLCLISIIVFTTITRTRKLSNGILLSLLFTGLVVIFYQGILAIIARIAPVLVERLLYSASNEERALLLQEAWEAFLNNPVLGDRFAIIHADGKFIYSHNMLLDALMGTGIIGGTVFAAMYISSIIDSYKIAKHDLSFLWIVLILIQHITAGMTSSAFYLKPVITALIIFVSLSSVEKREEETETDENET